MEKIWNKCDVFRRPINDGFYTNLHMIFIDRILVVLCPNTNPNICYKFNLIIRSFDRQRRYCESCSQKNMQIMSLCITFFSLIRGISVFTLIRGITFLSLICGITFYSSICGITLFSLIWGITFYSSIRCISDVSLIGGSTFFL